MLLSIQKVPVDKLTTVELSRSLCVHEFRMCMEHSLCGLRMNEIDSAFFVVSKSTIQVD